MSYYAHYVQLCGLKYDIVFFLLLLLIELCVNTNRVSRVSTRGI
jgi:hypothetical protein